MAGKIIADQIEHSTAGSLDTSYVVNGSAKAWALHNDSTAQDSFNIASITDVGTGNYRPAYTSSMNSVNYTAAGWQGNNSNGVVCGNELNTGYIDTFYKTLGSGGSSGDCSQAGISVLGDLA